MVKARERKQRYRQTETLLLHNATAVDISQSLGVSIGRAYAWINKVRAAWKVRLDSELPSLAAKEAASLDRVEAVLLDGLGESPKPQAAMIVDRILRIKERRARLLGLDAPDRMLSQAQVTVVHREELSGFTVDELRRLLAAIPSETVTTPALLAINSPTTSGDE